MWGTSVRKHWVVLIFCSFQCFLFVVFFGFTMVLSSFGLFLFVVHKVLLCFGWSPLVFLGFSGFRIGFERKPKENYWKTNPSRLRGLSGASFWVSPSSVISLSHVTERGEYSLGRSGSALGFLISQ